MSETTAPITSLTPAAQHAFDLWRQRQERWDAGQPEPKGAYAAELRALAACDDDEWDQVAAAEQAWGRNWLAQHPEECE